MGWISLAQSISRSVAWYGMFGSYWAEQLLSLQGLYSMELVSLVVVLETL